MELRERRANRRGWPREREHEAEKERERGRKQKRGRGKEREGEREGEKKRERVRENESKSERRRLIKDPVDYIPMMRKRIPQQSIPRCFTKSVVNNKI